MKVDLIRATAEDLEFLFDLRKTTMVEHLENAGLYFSDQDHMSRVLDFFQHSRIITKSTEKIGLLKYRESDGFIEIIQFQIASNCQGEGIGKQVLERLISRSRNSGKEITLKVLKGNPAKRFYERYGFQIVGEDLYEYHMGLRVHPVGEKTGA
jgi:ribosomal protein S18 acetylase RimI-like enzyme